MWPKKIIHELTCDYSLTVKAALKIEGIKHTCKTYISFSSKMQEE